MKRSGLFVETACKQACHGNHAPCGDKFLQQQFPAHGHTVVILSDGMGQGVKAHLLSTLTASIFMGMAGAPQSIEETARTVMQTLPVCRVRKISYSTFSIVDIDHRNDTIRLIEYDNPQAFLFRGTTPIEIERTAHPYPNLQTGRLQTFYTSRFTMQRGDRIVLTTDGDLVEDVLRYITGKIMEIVLRADNPYSIDPVGMFTENLDLEVTVYAGVGFPDLLYDGDGLPQMDLGVTFRTNLAGITRVLGSDIGRPEVQFGIRAIDCPELAIPSRLNPKDGMDHDLWLMLMTVRFG